MYKLNGEFITPAGISITALAKVRMPRETAKAFLTSLDTRFEKGIRKAPINGRKTTVFKRETGSIFSILFYGSLKKSNGKLFYLLKN